MFIIENNLAWMKITNNKQRAHNALWFGGLMPVSHLGSRWDPFPLLASSESSSLVLICTPPWWSSVSHMFQSTLACCLLLSELLYQCRQLPGLLSVVLWDLDLKGFTLCDFFWTQSILWNRGFKNFGKRTPSGLRATPQCLCSPFLPGSRSLGFCFLIFSHLFW